MPLQRCSPPALVLSLSPGLGPDGLPSPGGYFPHAQTNGSGNNGLSGGGPSSSGGATAAGGGSSVGGAASGAQGNIIGSCNGGNSNNPSPVTMMGMAQNSHRSSPCNELLAAAMRSSHATNAAGESTLHNIYDTLHYGGFHEFLFNYCHHFLKNYWSNGAELGWP